MPMWILTLLVPNLLACRLCPPKVWAQGPPSLLTDPHCSLTALQA